MSVINPNSKAGDVLRTGAELYASNATGAEVLKGEIGAFQVSDQTVIAVADAATARLPLVVAVDTVASGAVGRWILQGIAECQVAAAVNTTGALVMTGTASTGGATLVAMSAGSGQAVMSCGLTIEAGADTVPTDVLFDGLSGRVGGQGAVS